MPGFAESFWSTDYAAGLGVMFGKLQQGVTENRQVLTIARLRAEAEDVYGERLSGIAPAVDKMSGGFSRDDGASVRKAYEGVRTEMEDAAKSHKKIAQNIRDLVVNPFSRWCDAHESRVQDSQDELMSRIKTHDKQAEAVKKLRSNYFNKCRLVEDLEEENQLAFQDPETSPKPNQPIIPIPEIKVHEDDDDNEPYEIGDEIYPPDQVKKIIAHMLNNVKMGETKVPILGTYLNTSSGSDIVEYLQRNMGTTSVSYAERVGQDLVTHGFLRLVGNVGNSFANSSKMYYQWRPKAFQLSGVPEKKAIGRTFSLPTSGADASESPMVGAVNEYLSKWNLNNANPNETPAQRLRREAKESDEKYRSGVRKLDEMRCELEEAIYVHLKFLERCELDRLKAIKTVILDFSGTISNVIPSLQSTVDNMMLYQETVQPLGDLRYLLENYRTGNFTPKVVVYENYYNKVEDETFGVDLEARARADKKRVPIIVTSLLTYLDHHYPDLEGDEARRGVWLHEVPLSQTHKLRAKTNDGKPPSMDVFAESDIPTVASLLKLYLLELPDSLVSAHVYEIIRTIYNTPTGEMDNSDGARVAVLQQTLSQLRLSNIATLDACMNHFTRLIDLTSADEDYVNKLANTLAPCILRPRTETSLTMEEKHAYRLIRDLFTHKDAIFSELKRMSTLSHSNSVSGSSSSPSGLAAGRDGAHRPRAISTDESNRKAHVEERNRALLEKASGSRSRATSPAPGPRSAVGPGPVPGPATGAPAGMGHRRDRSIGGPETRFPIQTSPTVDRSHHRQSIGPILPKRASLEVPDSVGPVAGQPSAQNGGMDDDALHHQQLTSAARADDGIAKSNSLGRSSARFVGGRRVPPSGGHDTGHEGGAARHGVTLEDRPMDD